jgi:molybdate transport system substrate-binding protein
LRCIPVNTTNFREEHPMRITQRLLTAAILAGLVVLPAGAARADDLSVFAAASLKDALGAVDAAFQAETGKAVVASFAASSALARQIEQGAPADVFISADLAWMDYLAERDLVRPETRADLLGNALVIVAPTGSGVTVEPKPGFDLAAALGGDGRLAVGEVRSVPAGKYARAALESLGAWTGVAERLAESENVRSALLLVSRGEAPLGIVYRTDAVADPGVEIAGTFPADSHPPIVYPVAVTAASSNPDAGAYVAFLRGPVAAAIFEKAGFAVLGTAGTN